MPKALIIDSDAPVAQALNDALSARGVSVQLTADGTDGLEFAKANRPDVIVLCVELARGSGYSVCNKLKKDSQLAPIPLILTSSQATEETFEQHKKLRTRAEAYLKKPYELGELLKVVSQYVELSGGAGAKAAPVVEEVEVSVDEIHVEGAGKDQDDEFLDVNFEAEAGGGPQSPEDALNALMDTSAARTAVAKTPARPASSPAPVAARRSEPAAAAPAAHPAAPERRSTANVVNDAETERLRNEVKTLRQRVQKLEQEAQSKEVEFNDRLLQESSRSREALDLKKKLQAVERDITKHQQLAERAQEEASQAQRQHAELQARLDASEAERGAMTEKLGQLVDKVKDLAAERDALKAHTSEMERSRATAQTGVEAAEKVREKAKKAVDIAMQLLDETGLVH